MAARFNELQFEPHNGYGAVDPDGEPWPFGYISTAPIPMPVFELGVVLEYPADDLRKLALAMAAAPEMVDTLLNAKETLQQLLDNHLDRASTLVRELVRKRIAQIDDAIASADGRHGE